MKKLVLLAATMLAGLLSPAQLAFQWSAYYNGPGDHTERINCSARDAAGNIYLGGATINPNANFDYWVIKLDAAGDTVWTWYMDGPDHGEDQVLAIAADASGKVAVTGFSKSIDNGDDALTVLLDANGTPLWTNAYNNVSGNEDDQGVSVAFTPSGGVAVCGYGDRDPQAITNNDYFTVQYDAAGAQAWGQTYNGSGLANDRAADLAVDGSGNVYVTGRSNNGSDDDYITLKYNSSGAQQWIRTLDFGATDRATCIGLDPSGNVIVSGRSDTGNDDDFYTIKYDPAGTQLWARAANFVDDDRAISLVVDGNGAVYVTGQSDGDASGNRNWDYMTVKYDAAGTQTWLMRYATPGTNYDLPTSIALSDNGNVFVTGASADTASNAATFNMLTLGYAVGAGTQLFTQTYAGTGGQYDYGSSVVGTATGCVVSGTSYSTLNKLDGIALRYDGTGTLLSEKRFYGWGDNNDNLNAMAIDALGNLSIAGYQVQEGQDRNILLLKLQGIGAADCQRDFSGTSTPSPDASQGIALDASGNAMIAGYVKNSGESYAMSWIKFTATCDTQYTRKYNATPEGSDKIYDMVGDNAGNVYITGKVDADATYLGVNDNCFTAKINASGAIVWSRSYASAGTAEDRGSKVVLSNAGNTYVVGKSLISGNYDLFLVKYDALGIQQWAQTWGGGFGNDEPYDLAVDGSDNIYIAARTEETAIGQYDYVTLKYDATGALTWARTYNGVGTGDDQPQALAVDGVGNVYVTGRVDVDATAAENLDVVTLKYDAAGSLSWEHTLGDAADDHADDLAVSPVGNVYITGHVNRGTVAASQFDVLTFILDHSATVLWQDTFDGLGGSDDIPSVLLVQGNDVFVGGSSINPGQDKDILVLKYSGAVGVAEPDFAADIAVFPNPAQGQVTVRNLGKPMKDAQLQLMDETGRVVRILTMQIAGDTEVSLAGLPAGMYLYGILQGGKIVARGKIAQL